MVRAVLAESGVSDRDLSVVPFPINLPERYRSYVPLDATFFLTIYDEWGRRKRELFESMGLAVEVLWDRPQEEKGISGEEIRERMARGEAWEHMVPPAAQRLLHAWDIPTRIRKLLEG
jgi:nicotinamide-nucleotide adenylyltransferase